MKLKTNKWHRFQFNFNRFDEMFPYSLIKGSNVSGVYAIFIDDDCTYIGCSRKVFSRLKLHIKNAHIFIPKTSKMEIAIKLTDKSLNQKILYHRNLERRLIKKIKPPGNFNSNNNSFQQKKDIDLVTLIQIKQLREIGESKNMNFTEMAEEIGITKQSVRAWIVENRKPCFLAMRPIREFIEKHNE